MKAWLQQVLVSYLHMFQEFHSISCLIIYQHLRLPKEQIQGEFQYLVLKLIDECRVLSQKTIVLMGAKRLFPIVQMIDSAYKYCKS